VTLGRAAAKGSAGPGEPATPAPARRRPPTSRRRAAEAGRFRLTAKILARLERSYGRPRQGARSDPLDELILTVLSQNTNDRNRDRAYAELRKRFPRWADVLAASDSAVARAIAVGGLANQKSKRIRKILSRIRAEHGELDLGFLKRWGDARVGEYLRSFVGVGEKTANCVLLFALGRPAFPVDTHIHRLALRLGLVPEGSDAAAAHQRMGALVPARDSYSAHLNLIRHGREVCHARRPACGACVLADLCPSRMSGG
jgi:endonuclease III